MKKNGILQEISYEMARPKSFLMSLFDLQDREIDRQYKAYNAAPIAPPSAPGLTTGADVEMAPDAATADTEEQRRTLRAATAQKKNTFEMNVVERDEEHNGGNDTPTDNSPTPEEGAPYHDEKKLADKDKPDETPAAKPKPPKVDAPDSADPTFAQWRTLLNEQPTLENMKKFMIAYQNKKVTSEEYYAITEELMEDPRVEKQAMAVYGLSGFPAGKSFILLAHYSESVNSEGRKAQVDAILDSYSNLQRLPNLKTVLVSQDPLAIGKALAVLEQGIAQAQNRSPADTTETTDQRAFRGRSFYPTLQIFKGFVDLLEPLSKEMDQPYVPLAAKLLSQLQDEKTAALAPSDER